VASNLFKFGDRDWLSLATRNLLLPAVSIAGFVLIIWSTGAVMAATAGAKVVTAQSIMQPVTFIYAVWMREALILVETVRSSLVQN